MSVNRQAFEKTIVAATVKLLGERTTAGHWEGQLSSSALSTATSVCALTLSRRNRPYADINSSAEPQTPPRTGSQSATKPKHLPLSPASDQRETIDAYESLAASGVNWLLQHQNEDGGWGDTIKSYSNISTTVLCWSVLGLPEWPGEQVADSINRAERWLTKYAGGLTPEKIAAAVIARYGKDRTFSIPILTMCALCGRLGEGRSAWRYVLSLPFELAACPHQLFKWLKLPVVSYALPALIAIGQTRHHHRPTLNPLSRLIRWLTRKRTLSVLENIQPTSGGFLEAAPLTGFVVMSLASMDLYDHPVTKQGLAFLADGVRNDGSWPIDTNLATWTTTLAVNALASEQPDKTTLCEAAALPIFDWLLTQQYRVEHPYTHAAPGGWAWTNLTGGVPDADDTPGALLALHNLTGAYKTDTFDRQSIGQAVAAGCQWLLDVQNRDGGIPTFCRGWGNLPFDRSSQDITAHTLRAWLVWRKHLPEKMQRRVDIAIKKTLAYLLRTQRPNGAWIPLWFGSQDSPNEENPTYGTARVLIGLEVFLLQQVGGARAYHLAYSRAVEWLSAAQCKDGGWGEGGNANAPSSIEETALAVDALCGCIRVYASQPSQQVDLESLRATIDRGVGWLIEHTHHGTQFDSAPIGFYFAKLWYFEQLYPLIFAVGALFRARAVLWKPNV